MGWTALALLSLGAAQWWAAPPLAAQGVTGAAIEGRIVGVDSTPLEQAIVQVTNTSNGERWQTTTSARGRYFLEYLSVSGPYRIEVRAVGYRPARQDSIRLGLGQRLTAHFTLTPAVMQLQEISVTGAADPRLGADRTGPAQIISDSTIARLPVPGRDFTELAVLAPQVTRSPNGGLSFAGQHDRLNSIQVDGIGNNGPFGRAHSGNNSAGWELGLRALPPEAIEEIQVQSAPFDVRAGRTVTPAGSARTAWKWGTARPPRAPRRRSCGPGRAACGVWGLWASISPPVPRQSTLTSGSRVARAPSSRFSGPLSTACGVCPRSAAARGFRDT